MEWLFVAVGAVAALAGLLIQQRFFARGHEALSATLARYATRVRNLSPSYAGRPVAAAGRGAGPEPTSAVTRRREIKRQCSLFGNGGKPVHTGTLDARKGGECGAYA
jgi:hypothetical protein